MSRKKRPEHPNHERWLVSYADFITLLFAFFVVLYSSAQVDMRKVGELAKAIQTAFQQMGVFEGTDTKPSVLNTETAPFPRVARSEMGQSATTPQRLDFGKVQQQLESALAPEIQKHTVSVTPTKEGIVVSLRELGFFDSGSTSLRPEAMPALAAFVKVAGPLHSRIRIEGHTDNVPIHNERFDSNWELSTARATEIIKLFISKYGIAPERLSASGYGEYYPVASNSSAEGRALNRRVDLVIWGSTTDSSPQLPPTAPGVASQH